MVHKAVARQGSGRSLRFAVLLSAIYSFIVTVIVKSVLFYIGRLNVTHLIVVRKIKFYHYLYASKIYFCFIHKSLAVKLVMDYF